MVKRGLVLCFVLGIVSYANADAVINLVPDNPGDAGVYDGGETILVDVVMADATEDFLVRGFQFDLADTDPMIALNGDFSFNFDDLILDAFYYIGTEGSVYPVVNATYTATEPTDGFIIDVAGPRLMGQISLTLPTQDGEYLLDVMNSTVTGDDNLGAYVTFGFGGEGDDVTFWRSNGEGDGLLTGGALTFVVPEPATLSLLAIGALAAVRRRRKA